MADEPEPGTFEWLRDARLPGMLAAAWAAGKRDQPFRFETFNLHCDLLWYVGEVDGGTAPLIVEILEAATKAMHLAYNAGQRARTGTPGPNLRPMRLVELLNDLRDTLALPVAQGGTH